MSERFRVDLRGIIDLAANHLYSSPEVFVRELIQNGVDAITARRRLDPGHQGSVRLELVPGDEDRPATICATDNGVGLTTAEVHEFLSTVGGSSKRQEAQEAADRLQDDNMLGRFGIGLLSCFMVTDEIVVVTRSARDPQFPAVEWRGRGDGGYSVREMPGSTIAPGTSVYLTKKDDAGEYFEFEQLRDLARTYGQMLSTPIFVRQGDTELQVNAEIKPWEIDDTDQAAAAAYCQEAFGFQPLDAFRFAAPSGGAQGMVFIRSSKSSSWGDENKLYSRGMFVGSGRGPVVPEWAKFAAVAMDANGLRLVASRENFVVDAALEKARDELGAAIRDRLVRLLRTDRPKFETLMSVHDVDIRGMAVKDPAFFEIIIDMLSFETTLGEVRFGEFRRENHQIFVARTSEQYRRLITMTPDLGIRVFNGGYVFHEELLAKAVQRFPGLSLRSFDTADLAATLQDPQEPEMFTTLLDAAAESMEARGCEVVVREFSPEHMTGFYALGLDAEFHRQLDRTKAMSSALWKQVLEIMAPRPETLSPTRLCLNAKNPVVCRIATLSDRALQQTALDILYVQALMSGQFALTAQEMTMLNQGMETLLRRALPGGSIS